MPCSPNHLAERFLYKALGVITKQSLERHISEAIRDCELLRKTFDNEGELGVKRMGESLRNKASDMPVATPEVLEGIYNAMRQSQVAPERLIPPGEGWVRFNEPRKKRKGQAVDDEMLWEPRSEVYFAQKGNQMGKYLMKDRIARLTLKFPLSFLDSPASAFALFQGIRSAEAAESGQNFWHRILKPREALCQMGQMPEEGDETTQDQELFRKIDEACVFLCAARFPLPQSHRFKELQKLLDRVLTDLDAEVIKSPHAFSGSSAVLALLLGDRLVISAVGQFRVVLLFDDSSSRELMRGTDLHSDAERIEEARVAASAPILVKAAFMLKDSLIRLPDADSNDAEKVLMARNPFQVLQMEPQALDEKQVRTQYRKMALKDKQTEDAESFKKAFARLDGAKEVLESLCGADSTAVADLHQVLQAEEGAAQLLSVDAAPMTETEQLAEDAAKSSRRGIKKLEKLEHLEYDLAVATYREAVETLRLAEVVWRPASKEALPRQEALRLQSLSMSRALGVRDMRFPAPVVVMRPESVSWQVQRGTRVALLCGATAALTDQQLTKISAAFKRCPRASALRW
eukprot:s645_g5.t1